MDQITQSQKVMLHLYRYRTVDPYVKYMASYDMTQSGIGECLGISRSHASVVVGKLEKEGLLESVSATLSNAPPTGPLTRKVYKLTHEGLARCRELMDELGMEEGSPLPIVPRNINHCRTDSFDSLPDRDRDFLGCLIVLEMEVSLQMLPEGRDHPLVPIDTKGHVSIRKRTRELYMGRASPDELARWHSLAADFCADHGGTEAERMTHLILGRRRKEAVKYALCNGYALMDSPDRNLAKLMDELDSDTDGNPLAEIVTLCYIRLGMTHEARGSLSRMREGPLSGAMESELLLAEGRKSDALDKALESYNSDTATAIALGKCMAANSRYGEAAVFLRRARMCMMETKCLFRLDESLTWEGDCYLALGKKMLAKRLTEAAACAAKDDHRGRALQNKAESIDSEDLVDLQSVHV